jgi:3-hydroxybutyryl-CoA dehydratase
MDTVAPSTIAAVCRIGETTSFRKTLTEADVALFSAISGDFDPIHVDEAYAATTPFGRRIAHGLGIMALLSAAEAEMSRRALARGLTLRPVSLGYDRVRFLKPVFIGETVAASYEIAAIDEERRRTVAACRVEKADGTPCLAAQHIMKWIA